MARRYQARYAAPRPAARIAARSASTPLPGAVVDAVLRYHDQVEDQGCGRSLLRLSAQRLHDVEVEVALGEHAARAAGVSILWNEREAQIIRVLESARTRLAA